MIFGTLVIGSGLPVWLTLGLSALAFWLTDETFAVVENQLRHHADVRDGAWYWLGSSLAMYFNWQVWTVVAGVVTQRLSDRVAASGTPSVKPDALP